MLVLLLTTLMAAGCTTINETDMTTPSTKTVHSDNDKQLFLSKIISYIKDNKIDTAPAIPNQYNISSIEEGQYKDQEVWVVYLDCCFLGDIAYINKNTLQVIGFVTGAK